MWGGGEGKQPTTFFVTSYTNKPPTSWPRPAQNARLGRLLEHPRKFRMPQEGVQTAYRTATPSLSYVVLDGAICVMSREEEEEKKAARSKGKTNNQKKRREAAQPYSNAHVLLSRAVHIRATRTTKIGRAAKAIDRRRLSHVDVISPWVLHKLMYLLTPNEPERILSSKDKRAGRSLPK